MPQFPHSEVQGQLCILFGALRRPHSIQVAPEIRVKVAENRVRTIDGPEEA